MASRNHTYNTEQILYSFLRYRKDSFNDLETAREEFEKHFNPSLANEMFDKVASTRQFKQQLKENREDPIRTLDKSTRARIKEAREIKKWALVEIKGRKVRAREVTIKIKGKTVKRYRDSFGRFTSNPN